MVALLLAVLAPVLATDVKKARVMLERTGRAIPAFQIVLANDDNAECHVQVTEQSAMAAIFTKDQIDEIIEEVNHTIGPTRDE